MQRQTVRMSTKGQLVLPQEIRKELGITRGQQLALSVQRGVILMRPIHRLSAMEGMLPKPRENSQKLVHRLRKEWE